MPDTIFQKISAALGYRPSLCHVYSQREDGSCTCSNPTCRAAKHSDPTWVLYHEPNEGERYGVLCGDSGVIVIDVDVKDGKQGAQSLYNTMQRLGPLPTTLTVQTPSGGWHIYLRRPNDCPARDSKTVYGRDIDVKGSRLGLVIVDSRAGYRVVTDAPIAPMPQAWVNAFREQIEARELVSDAGSGSAVCDYENDPELLEWAREKFRKACRDKPGAVEGRGGQGDMFPWQLGLEARKLGLPPSESLPILLKLWNPKCQPPWETTGALAVDAQRGVPWLQRKIEGAWRGADVDCIGARFLRFIEPGGGFQQACERIYGARVQATPEQERALVDALHATSPVAVVAEKSTRQKLNTDHIYTWRMPSLAALGGKKDKLTQASLQVILDCDVWAGVWQYDEFGDRVVAVNPPMTLDAEARGLSEVDVTAVLTWLESTGRTASRETIWCAIEWVARNNGFHPVREYLDALPPLTSIDHARSVLRDVLARECFGVETDLEATYIERTMIAAVRRIFAPGCEVHTMLVLVGKQDRFKSRALKALFSPPWFKDQMPKLEGRDASHALHGKWGIEFSELGSIIRSDNATVKEFLSRAVDEYREYGTKQKIVYPRQCVFFGTTNDDEFLRDETGNRRFWPVMIMCIINLQKIVELRDMFWAAAKMLADEGAPHWFTASETEAAEPTKLAFVVSDPWELEIAQCFTRLRMDPERLITTSDVLLMYAGTERGRQIKLTRGDQMRVAAILKKLGYANRVVGDPKNAYKTKRAWYKPDE